ncbi:MAG: adenosylcobinamide-GDP ribazoletransferase [Aquimonas sp.]|nr:adenosylcobinamide-GDP ribazoletransferase [Aquimonas sp.]
MSGLWFALAFLTRLPTPRLDFDDVAGQSAALAWYPAVGGLIGLGLVALALGLETLQLPALLSAALLLAAWVWVSGGLHLDGLADCADAFSGGHGDRERLLRILKDPAAGPMGVIAIVLILLLKLAALTALVETQALAWLLVLPPLLGRAGAVALFLPATGLPYLREGGLGARLAAAPMVPCLIVLLLSAGACLLMGFPGLAALIAAAIAWLHWRSQCARCMGGFTGDAAGSAIERVELAALLALAVLA